MRSFISSELTPSLGVISFCNFLLGFMFHYRQIMLFLCLAHTLIYGWAHAQTHLQNLHTHTQLHTHIVSAHDPVHYCYWTTGWWMVNRLACLEERTVVKPAVNCFLYHESKINFETHYLYGWFKGTLWEEMRILFPISSFSLHVFICVCVYIHACVNVLCVFVCISLSKVNLIVMWTTKNIYNVVFSFVAALSTLTK